MFKHGAIYSVNTEK